MIPIRVPADAKPVLASDHRFTIPPDHPLDSHDCPACGLPLTVWLAYGDRKAVLRPRSVKRAAEAAGTPARKRPPETGFTDVERLAVRTRAGNGDPEQAACECCGRWLGRYGGQVHHRQNHQSGGSRLRNRLSNALLACGSPFEFCHGMCTIGVGAVKRAMQAMGFVLENGQDPLTEPVMLHGQDGGLLVWLDDDAHYRDAQGNILTAPAPEAS